MSPCFETLLIREHKPLHVSFHNARFWATSRVLFGVETRLDLASLITPPLPACRCKITYAKEVLCVEYSPLVPREFRTFKLVETSHAYGYKYVQRGWIDAAKEAAGTDEVLFTCKGYLTDTSIANIALLIGGKWCTPKTPLLKGTARARWLQEGRICETALKPQDLKNAQKFAIMNALLEWQEYPIQAIAFT